MIDITTAKDTFERTWLDAVVNFETGPPGPITRDDLLPGGALHDTYSNICNYSLRPNPRFLEDAYRATVMSFIQTTTFADITESFMAIYYWYIYMQFMRSCTVVLPLWTIQGSGRIRLLS